MITNATFDEINVTIHRKKIKNLHLKVRTLDGSVHLSIPWHTGKQELNEFILNHLDWIREQQQKALSRPTPPRLKMITGDTVMLWGKRNTLVVSEPHGFNLFLLGPKRQITLMCKANTSTKKRLALLDDWYRYHLERILPGLFNKWQPIVGKAIREWRIKKMKTRWGTCNIQDKRIWINLELAKQPFHCIEYVVVHELVHLLEASHNHHFKAQMDRCLPGWCKVDKQLNKTALSLD